VADQAPRFHLHFAPTSASWLNLVERWFAELTNRKLKRSAHRSVTELEETSGAGSTTGIPTPNHSSGPRPPTKSSKPSPHTACELTPQHTRSAGRADTAGLSGRDRREHQAHPRCVPPCFWPLRGNASVLDLGPEAWPAQQVEQP
jgi:hypothetical protein